MSLKHEDRVATWVMLTVDMGAAERARHQCRRQQSDTEPQLTARPASPHGVGCGCACLSADKGEEEGSGEDMDENNSHVPRMSALFFHRPPICERATDHTYTKGCGHLGKKCGWDQV